MLQLIMIYGPKYLERINNALKFLSDQDIEIDHIQVSPGDDGDCTYIFYHAEHGLQAKQIAEMKWLD